MRVAVHHPARTEEDGTAVPESVSAFRMGRIEDFVNPLTGETTPKDEVAAKLMEDAKAEHPDCVVVLEELHDNGDGTSTWVTAGTAEAPQAAGATVAAPELAAAQTQEAGQ